MAFNFKQFKQLVITTLLHFNPSRKMVSNSAINLELGTCAHETKFGTYLRQFNNGPGQGVFSFERNTEVDMWKTYLIRKPNYQSQLYEVCGVVSYNNNHAMIWNLAYQIIMVRLYYWRDPRSLPDANDVWALGEYWDSVYNKNPYKGTAAEFVKDYKRYCK